MSDLWTTIAAERGALAGDLAALRRRSCDDLIGAGVPTLRGRCAAAP